MTSANETVSALLALCAGNSPAMGEFPSQRPVTRIFGDLGRHRGHCDVIVMRGNVSAFTAPFEESLVDSHKETENMEHCCFHWQIIEQTVMLPIISDVMTLMWCYCNGILSLANEVGWGYMNGPELSCVCPPHFSSFRTFAINPLRGFTPNLGDIFIIWLPRPH